MNDSECKISNECINDKVCNVIKLNNENRND